MKVICSLKHQELKGSYFFLREPKATEESLNTRCFASLSMTKKCRVALPTNFLEKNRLSEPYWI
jgi:hypothetical protein